MRELGTGRLVLLGVVVERTTAGEGDEGDATSHLEEALPERRLVNRRRWWGLDGASETRSCQNAGNLREG